ncbi:DNA adenine methylase [Alistipes putredinis]|jgi:site-specific DNA-adenine methylase|uniref:DNA adenine methylase n=1 Tax=Alistipes putredinis TaxID=28117 RepID=UPI003AB68405
MQKHPVYNSAPLPFQGQKRRFVGEFRKALSQFPDAAMFVDLFGGSGLLSHVAKQERPEARVVYNDFDDFRQRLENIPRTNALLAKIRNFVGGGISKGERMPEELRARILDLIRKEEETGFVDYITLSSSLLFSGRRATSFEELAKESFNNNVKQTDYLADGYLDGVEIVKADYRELFMQYKDAENVVFLVDPPYLSTDTTFYKCYWKLADYLDVLKVLEGHAYIYFTSNKSQIIELIDWFCRTQFDANPFAGTQRHEIKSSINHQAGYTDIMMVKNYARSEVPTD